MKQFHKIPEVESYLRNTSHFHWARLIQYFLTQRFWLHQSVIILSLSMTLTVLPCDRWTPGRRKCKFGKRICGASSSLQARASSTQPPSLLLAPKAAVKGQSILCCLLRYLPFQLAKIPTDLQSDCLPLHWIRWHSWKSVLNCVCVCSVKTATDIPAYCNIH